MRLPVEPHSVRRDGRCTYDRGVDFDWSPELQALRAEAEEVADKAIAEYGEHDDAWINGYSREFSRELGRRGWLGMTWPVEWGGGGRTVLERFVVTETLIAKGAPIAGSWFADRQMGPSILTYGTEEQKKQFLPGIISGETGWCIGMSEPDAGSDLASLRTRAIRDGDTYVIDGQKIWTSFGETAELLLPDLPHVDRRTSTRRHQRAHRSARLARHHDHPDQGHDDEPPLLRGLLRGRARPGGEPRR